VNLSTSFWSGVKYLLIDSRNLTVPEKTVFFALHGVKHDGHQFIEPLYKWGVRKFVVTSIPATHLPDADYWVVPNVLEVLQKVANAHRLQYNIPVIGITGSNGKTIVKEWLYQMLADRFAIVKSPKSYNSQIGVPLSVWEMADQHNLAIFEAGISQKGEMQRLATIIQPTIGIFTNIGSAHDEGFANRQEKACEKALLFSTCKQLIFCADYPEILSATNALSAQKISWTRQENVQATFQVINSQKATASLLKFISLSNTYPSLEVELPFSDEASTENAINCLITMIVLGINPQEIRQKVTLLRNLPMRLEVKKGNNQCTIIDDTYNNDGVGLRIALQFQSQQAEGKARTLILSDMEQTQRLVCQDVAALLAQYPLHRFIGIGTQLTQNQELFKQVGKVQFFSTTDDFLANIPDFREENILIKGSRHFHFEKIVEALQEKIHGTRLEINLDALAHNLGVYKSLLKPSVKLMVMVKAFAYGAGAVEVAKLLEYHRVDYLAVAYTDEGVTLRKAGITLPIMVMNPHPETFNQLFTYQLEPVVYNFFILEKLTQTACYHQKSHPIHLEIDTGMRRLGFEAHNSDEIIALTNYLLHNTNMRVVSIFTHLAGADDNLHDDFSLSQLHLFENTASLIESKLNILLLKHALNSPGITRFPDYQFDMVRLGIGLYGVDTNNTISHLLKPISTLKTTISQIKILKKGETIGYGRYGIVSDEEMRLATIAIGYGDGYSRRFSRGVGKVLVKGVLCPVVGNICMDMTMIDITHTTAQEGDEVMIFGEYPTITTLATQIGTIPYEILTNVGERVKRIFFSA